MIALSKYQNQEVAKAASKAFNRHLWYLSELLAGFAFFDDDVSVEEKRLVVIALTENEGAEEPSKGITPFLEPQMKGLPNFVMMSTARFFRILGLGFLQNDPSEWEHDEQYQRNKEVVGSIKVVDDLAERGVCSNAII